MRARSLQRPAWMPYGSAQLPGAKGGQGGGWGEKDTPKRLFERCWGSARRRQGFKVEAGC